MKKNYAFQFLFRKSHLLLFAKFFLVGIFLLSQLDASAQQERTISGLVTGIDKAPMPGVTVLVKGTTAGALTDVDGRFTLTIPATSQALLFSFVGMQTQEILIGPGNVYDIILLESIVGLEEVVVVGYGSQKKESVVGAISQMDSKMLQKSTTSNITNAISGKLSGVLTIQQQGEPGADQSEIVIRGLSSWNTSAPLTLVDGVERDFKNLDPNEIETISILKDASATAVFGAKGANGVIIVTTKRGLIGRPQLSFTGGYGFEMISMMPDFIDAYTTMSMMNVGFMNRQLFTSLVSANALKEFRNPSTPLKSMQYPNNNWFDLLTVPFAPTSNANLNIQGGNETVKYFSSLGYFFQGDLFNYPHEGVYDRRFTNKRINYRTNIDLALSKTSQLSLNVGGDISIKNQPSSSSWDAVYGTGVADFPAFFPAWVLEQVPDLDYPDATGVRVHDKMGGYYGNPYADIRAGDFNQYTSIRLFTDLILDQKLNSITKGLSVRGKISLSTYYQNRSLGSSYTSNANPLYQLNYSRIGVDANGDGKVDQNPWILTGQENEVFNKGLLDIGIGELQGNFSTNLYYEIALNYSRSFGRNNIDGMVLFNRQQQNNGTQFPYYNEAYVGRATYNYFHKYLLEVNIGYTGSERFAPANRFGFFPSGALGWVISEEPFFKNAVPWMNKLKIRYSDGLVGSDYATNRWLYVSSYNTNSVGGVSSGNFIQEGKGANLTAQWEEARKRNIGVEISIFKNQFSLSFDLFDEYRDKMLLTPQTVTILVANSFNELNLGSLKKHGFELEAEFNKTVRSNFNYYIKGMFGFNENRIIFKDDPVYAPEYSKAAGKPLSAQLKGVLLTGTGYFTSVNDIHTNPSPIAIEKLVPGMYKFLDYQVDGSITNLDEYPIKGSLYPPITYSLTSGFSYKGFNFHFMFQGNSGKYVDYNQAFESEFLRGASRVHSSQLDYWRPDNPNANHSTLLYYTGESDMLLWGGGEAIRGYTAAIQGRFWRNADYVRLKEIYAEYTLGLPSLQRLLQISNLRVYATGNNIFTLTSLIEGDPERKDFEVGFYPQMRTIIFGLGFTF